VSTIPVNAEAPDEFYDIADIWKPPFVLADYYPYIIGFLVIWLLVAAIAYIIQRIRNRKPILPFMKEKPELQPHEKAFKELDQIKQQKLWQQGRNKEYYTLITETLRKYMAARFGFRAMDMTSSEILTMIRRESEVDSVYEELNQVLQLADYVKFAKLAPLPDENELSMMNAYLFVNQTKPVEVLTPETTQSTLTKE
jgi:hypothetical protein